MINKNINEEELIKLVQSGDEEAFNLLYERYSRLIYFIAYKLCNSDADSQDVAQETFLQIKRTINDLKNPELFKYWLNRIVISKCKNLFRKNKYITYDDEHFESKNNLLETREDVQPDCLLKFNSDKEMLNSFIDEFPQGQKEVVILHYLEQFSVEETADLLELPVGTVKSRLSYARATLKAKIEKYEKNNNTKLNFHSLDALLASALLYSLEQTIVPDISQPLASTHKKTEEIKLFSDKKRELLLCGALLLVGGIGIYTWLQNDHAEDASPAVVEETNTFPDITIRNEHITSARIAYYTIKTWACCEEEMRYLSEKELKDVYELYLIMKEDNSHYYQSLVEEGWVNSLEQVYQ